MTGYDTAETKPTVVYVVSEYADATNTRSEAMKQEPPDVDQLQYDRTASREGIAELDAWRRTRVFRSTARRRRRQQFREKEP